jgi:outer membrane protein assembly factor BamB
MKTTTRSLLLLAAVSLLSACSTLNPFSSKAPKPAELVSFQPDAELRSLWQVRVGSAGGYVFHPAVIEGDVYAAAHDGSLMRVSDGRVVWRANPGARLSAGAGSDGRVAAVVTVGGEVVAFDASNGVERWRASAGAEVLAPPAVTAAAVVVRASDHRVTGFDVNDGRQLWTFERATPPLALRSSAGMLSDGRVAIVGYPGGKLVALDTVNGAPLWELTVATPRGVTELERITDVAGTAVVSRREICAVAFQGRATCFDLESGNAIWSREFSSAVGMDRDTRLVFITDAADAVHALDAFSGANVWKQDAMTRRKVSRPVALDDFVAVGDLDGYVHLLHRETGRFAARTRVDSSAIVAGPQRLPGQQRFVVQTRDGSLAAYEAR